jgi:cytochrome c-type biogenesis protein CcmE
LLSNRRRQRIAATALICAVIALAVGLHTSLSASAGQAVASGAPAGGPVSGGAGSNARSGPAAGGASGTIGSMSKSRFTLTTSAGQKVTISKASSTKYEKGTSSISASAITNGASVLVLGTTSGTTITAKQVIVQSSGGSAPSSAATVVPFKQGAPTTAKTVGKIPATYSEGSGTIVSGTAANKATEAALAAYPGGIVDRVVKLSNGEYEVHNIGVNWPHHIFVSKAFKVVGAE